MTQRFELDAKLLRKLATSNPPGKTRHLTDATLPALKLSQAASGSLR
jgi:hypothetical protein